MRPVEIQGYHWADGGASPKPAVAEAIFPLAHAKFTSALLQSHMPRRGAT